jgi:hypothetical protein
MKVFQHYYGHDNLFSIGAWTPGCALQPSAPWYVAVVGKFDAGDVCTNYVSCGTALRQSVANYIGAGGKANGLTYVITGPLSCEEEFRTTSADSISPLSGAQMEQQFIKEFVLMNGCAKSSLGYPCALETNCLQNTAACSAFFANVTSQNGYPPVFVVPLNTGAGDVHIQVPLASLPLTNPTACAFNVAGRSEAADEDAVALEYAVFGSIGWTVSADSTNIVNAATSANSWSSSTASGQYYLSVATSPTSFENIIASPWLPE